MKKARLNKDHFSLLATRFPDGVLPLGSSSGRQVEPHGKGSIFCKGMDWRARSHCSRTSERCNEIH